MQEDGLGPTLALRVGVGGVGPRGTAGLLPERKRRARGVQGLLGDGYGVRRGAGGEGGRVVHLHRRGHHVAPGPSGEHPAGDGGLERCVADLVDDHVEVAPAQRRPQPGLVVAVGQEEAHAGRWGLEPRLRTVTVLPASRSCVTRDFPKYRLPPMTRIRFMRPTLALYRPQRNRPAAERVVRKTDDRCAAVARPAGGGRARQFQQGGRGTAADPVGRLPAHRGAGAHARPAGGGAQHARCHAHGAGAAAGGGGGDDLRGTGPGAPGDRPAGAGSAAADRRHLHQRGPASAAGRRSPGSWKRTRRWS